MRILDFEMWAGCLALVMAAVLSTPSPGQEPAETKPETGAARLEEMGRIVRSITLSRDDSGARHPVELRAEPLHRWSDPTRLLNDGALWAWGGTGRPTALTSIELYPVLNGDPYWSIEMLSLSSVPLDAEGGGRSSDKGLIFHWTPPPADLGMKPVPGAPQPAPTGPARLRQARELAERFTAEQVNRRPVERRFVLRLLPRPIYRYSDPDHSLLDGAIFLFANGTNPEILLFLEARGESPHVAWSYGAARLSRAAPEVFLDKVQVWSQPYAVSPGPRDPYFTVIWPRERGD